MYSKVIAIDKLFFIKYFKVYHYLSHSNQLLPSASLLFQFLKVNYGCKILHHLFLSLQSLGKEAVRLGCSSKQDDLKLNSSCYWFLLHFFDPDDLFLLYLFSLFDFVRFLVLNFELVSLDFGYQNQTHFFKLKFLNFVFLTLK